MDRNRQRRTPLDRNGHQWTPLDAKMNINDFWTPKWTFMDEGTKLVKFARDVWNLRRSLVDSSAFSVVCFRVPRHVHTSTFCLWELLPPPACSRGVLLCGGSLRNFRQHSLFCTSVRRSEWGASCAIEGTHLQIFSKEALKCSSSVRARTRTQVCVYAWNPLCLRSLHLATNAATCETVGVLCYRLYVQKKRNTRWGSSGQIDLRRLLNVCVCVSSH